MARRAVPLVFAIGVAAQLLTPSIAASLNDPALVPLLRAAFADPCLLRPVRRICSGP